MSPPDAPLAPEADQGCAWWNLVCQGGSQVVDSGLSAAEAGRWTRLREVAEAYTFVLTQMGGAEAPPAASAPAAAR